ncbi:MAG: hypothetical protein JO327_00480 [Nitrososphaeraceae archaeon]|nr:hypothetical protein [Nitrososphaeraceae archaeon]MBV9666582.1 hypothetical protein [Nitrososphaeraceae archaeon]
MDSTYLPQDTKRQYIRQLIQSNHNNYSDDDIARIAHTTKQYVWKEKSRMVSEGLLVSHRRTLKITAERKDETTTLVFSPAANSQGGRGAVPLSPASFPVSSSKRTNARSNIDGYARHLNIPPVDSEGIKKLYTEFKNKKKPVDIIAEHGFPPEVVELEYKRFLKLHDIDIQRLQDHIANELLKYPLSEVELLENSYKQKGYLTSEEMIQVLKKKDEYLRKFGWVRETFMHKD